MKKLLAVLLAVAMLFSVCAFSTSAEETPKVTIVTNQGSPVAKGTTTYFTVRFDNFSVIKGMDVTITADQNIELGAVTTSGFPTASEGNNYTESNEGAVHTIHFVDLTGGENGMIKFAAYVPTDAVTTADPAIKVTGTYADSGTTLFEVAAPANGTFELTKEIAETDISATETTANNSITVDVNTDEKFIPQGAVYIKNADGTYTYAKKQGANTFLATETGKYVYKSFDKPENKITTFGVSKYTDDDSRIRFGNYSELNTVGTVHGTLVFEGDWLELKNYYIQNGYTVQQFINAIYEDVTKKLLVDNKDAKFVYYKVNGKQINVYRFEQKNYMWKSDSDLEYAVRLNGAQTNTVYTGVAFSVSSDGSTVTISENVKSVKQQFREVFIDEKVIYRTRN